MKKKKPAKKKAKNPSDSTWRNTRAANKRREALEAKVKELEARIKRIEEHFGGSN